MMGSAMTLLRYPGGKTRAIKHLKKYMPMDVTQICSPFFGGGAFELHLANRGVKVYGYDSFEPLVSFWSSVLNEPHELYRAVLEYLPMSKRTFYSLQGDITKETDKLQVAAMFFALNRSSYSGLTLSGGMSPSHPRFTLRSIEKILQFSTSNLEIQHMDFRESIKMHKDKLLYCDPPYYISSDNLYGDKGDHHKGFDHYDLYKELRDHDNWLLSYNNHEFIRELYADYKQVELDWSYGTSCNNRSEPKELLIINTQ